MEWVRDDGGQVPAHGVVSAFEERSFTQGRPGVFISNTVPALVWVYEEAAVEVGLVLRVDSEAYDINGGLIGDRVAVFVQRCDQDERVLLHGAVQRRLRGLTEKQLYGGVPSGPVPSMMARRVLWR